MWASRRAEVADDLAVGEEEHAVGDRRGVRVVGDHHGRLAEVGDHAAQEREDLAAGARVEVAGRLVGEHDRRPRDERAGDRDALLLAAGELGRAVAEPLGEADLVGELAHPLAVRLAAGEREREHDVLGRREHRQQVEELEDEADVLTPQEREVVVGELRDVLAGDRHAALGRAVEAGEDVHQRRLAGARRAHDGGQLAGGDAEVDAAQRVDAGLALAVAADEAGRLDDGVGVLEEDRMHASNGPSREARRSAGPPGVSRYANAYARTLRPAGT